MNTIEFLLVDGYLALREGPYTFCDWISNNIKSEEMPFSILEFHYESNVSESQAEACMKAAFFEAKLLWPKDSHSESEYLQSVILLKYEAGLITGIDLINICTRIESKFGWTDRFFGLWDYLLEDIESLRYDPPGFLFKLKGADVENEIETELLNQGFLKSKRLFKCEK